MKNQQTPAEQMRRLNRLFGWSIVLATFVVYLLTLSTSLFPDHSAYLVAIYTGLEDLLAPSHFVFGLLCSFISSFFPSTAHALVLNLFSALCGSAAAGMLYLLVAKITYDQIDFEYVSTKLTPKASALAGVIASATLAFSVPFWMASTRLHYQTFDLAIALALALFYFSWAYSPSKKSWRLWLCAFLLGVMGSEGLIFLFLAGVCFLHVLSELYHRHVLTVSKIVLLAVCWLVGLSFFFVSAWHFCHTQDISLRGYTSFWSVASQIWLDLYTFAHNLVPRVGWILLGVLAVAPWLTMLIIARRALNETRAISFLILHIAMTAIVCAGMMNVSGSAWAVYRGSLVLPVALSTLNAIVAGYLAAYWFILAQNTEPLGLRLKRDPVIKMSVRFGKLFPWVLIIVIAATTFVNGFEASGKNGAFVDRCASVLLDKLEGRTWLLSDGLLDYHLRRLADIRGRELNLLAVHKNDNEVYKRQVAKIVDSHPDFAKYSPEDRTRLKNSLDLGILAFLQDWIALDPSVKSKLAVMSTPDFIVGIDQYVTPNFLCFVGSDTLDELSDRDFIAEMTPFWDEMLPMLTPRRYRNDPLAARRAIIRRQIGFVSNNMGVLLEDLGKNEEAWIAYNRVRSIDPDNISALLNMVEMLNRDEKFHPESLRKTEEDLDNFAKKLNGRQLPVWSLSRFYGYVRAPRLFVQLGWTWAMSGHPGIAVAGLKRAIDIAESPATQTRIREAMATLLLHHNDVEGSESLYAEILQSEPENQLALISMARLESRKGALEKAREWLSKAADAGINKTLLSFENAMLDLQSGNPEAARIKLTEITELYPNNMQAFSILAVAALQMNDIKYVEEVVIPKMESVAGTTDNYQVQITRGQMWYMKGSGFYKQARNAFERAAILRPSMTVLNEWVLRMDFLLADKTSAEVHARAILRNERNNSFANYIMGSLMLDRGRKAEAEDYLRRSIAASKTIAALNDLAELLRQMGNLDEAENYIRRAIEQEPTFYILWDTLGALLNERGRYDEAEAAYAKALELNDSDFRVHLSFAEFLFQRGKLIRARELLAVVRANKNRLSPTDLERLNALDEKRNQLRRNTK